MLKEKVETARKGRVVFSVLFRDIEKEIKLNEDSYKKNLLISKNSLKMQAN